MKIVKTPKKICPYCMNKVPLQQKLNNKWPGFKVRNGHVFCKVCSTEIK